MVQQHEPASETNLVAEIEEREIEAEVQRRLADRAGGNPQEAASSFARVVIWCLEADSVAKAGFRLHIVAAKLGIDVGRGMTNAELAELMGFRRTAAHNLGREFTRIFNVRGPHDRAG